MFIALFVAINLHLATEVSMEPCLFQRWLSCISGYNEDPWHENASETSVTTFSLSQRCLLLWQNLLCRDKFLSDGYGVCFKFLSNRYGVYFKFLCVYLWCVLVQTAGRLARAVEAAGVAVAANPGQACRTEPTLESSAAFCSSSAWLCLQPCTSAKSKKTVYFFFRYMCLTL